MIIFVFKYIFIILIQIYIYYSYSNIYLLFLFKYIFIIFLKKKYFQNKLKMALTGNKDTDYIILKASNDKTLLSYCQVDKRAQKICEDDSFWKDRFRTTFGESYMNLKSEKKTWKKYYLEIVSHINVDLRDKKGDFLQMIYASLPEYDREARDDFYRNSFMSTYGNWDVYKFFEKLFEKERTIGRIFFIDNKDELLKNYENKSYLSREIRKGLEQGISSFKILRYILEQQNDPELTRKTFKGIRFIPDLNYDEQTYVTNPYVQDFIISVENIL